MKSCTRTRLPMTITFNLLLIIMSMKPQINYVAQIANFRLCYWPKMNLSVVRFVRCIGYKSTIMPSPFLAILVEYQSLGMCPIHFGQVQIIKISPGNLDLNLTKIIWTWPKQFVCVQNNLDGPKSFWTYKRTGHNFPA